MSDAGGRAVVKRGDLFPPVRAKTRDARGAPVDLAGATLTFRMTPEVAGLRADVSGAASAVGAPADGVVEYRWQAGDTDVPGLYRAEFHAVFLDGSTETFPTDGYIVVEVQAAAVA